MNNTEHTPKAIAGIKRQRGLSLIEVMVAAFIFSLGILGLSSMQLVGLKMANGTNARNHAEFLASDILERIRVNRANASSYVIGINNQPVGKKGTVAQVDLDEWKKQLQTVLVNGRGSISLRNQRVTVTIIWSSRSEERKSKALNEQLVVSSDI